ncbi:toxin-activating lysine-acyltransferase [Chitinibacteraceae bacterium HSL-7]
MTSVLFCGVPNQHQTRVAQSLGHAIYLLTTCRGENRSVVPMANMLLAAIYHEQYRVFFDRNGSPIAFVTWAFPSIRVQNALAQFPDYVLHESEWDEGGAVWVLDLVVKPGFLRFIVNELRNGIFGECSVVRFAHQKRNTRRIVTWARSELK